MALAAGIKTDNPNFAVPDLFVKYFPSWFEGVAFAAVAIGALVPAAVMSIAAANLFTRNVWREFLRPDASGEQESRVAKLVSLFVKVGAVVFVLALPTEYAIDLQLLGGVWILQTLPSVAIGLFTRFLHRTALLAGWAGGMAVGTLMAVDQDFKSSVYPLDLLGLHVAAYEGVFALLVNLVLSLLLSPLLRAAGVAEGVDETRPEDYRDAEDLPGARPLPATPEQAVEAR
jgi:SSS family solute:Na+ symporter